jgi:hypothetical protein
LINGHIAAVRYYKKRLPDAKLVTLTSFDPLSLSPALWLSDTGSNAAQWDDLSGNGRHATQTTGIQQPEIVTNALNGRQVRRFDGSNDFMSILSGLNIIRNVAGATVFCAWEYITLPSSGSFRAPFVIATGTSDASGRISIGTNLGTTKMFSGGRGLDADALQRVDSTADATTNPFIQTALFDYANSDLFQYINGGLDGSSTSFQTAGNTSDTDSLAIRIGSHTGEGFFANIDIAEILVFPVALSAENRQNVESYLSQKYNIALA